MEEQELEQEKTTSQRGGARVGAGRKLKDKVPTQYVGFKLRKDYLQIILDNYENRSDFCQRAVKEKLRREGLI